MALSSHPPDQGCSPPVESCEDFPSHPLPLELDHAIGEIPTCFQKPYSCFYGISVAPDPDVCDEVLDGCGNLRYLRLVNAAKHPDQLTKGREGNGLRQKPPGDLTLIRIIIQDGPKKQVRVRYDHGSPAQAFSISSWI